MTEVSELRTVLATNAREDELLEVIESKLRALRAAYREREHEFTSDIVIFLKGVAALEGTLREFLEILEERNWVRTRDDAEDLATRFQDLAERLKPHLVAKRAEKEVRELVERSKTLPFAAIVSANADFRHRVARLEQKPRICHKCQSKMALRESQHGLFWGCTSFPKCFAHGWLSKSDIEVLNHDR